MEREKSQINCNVFSVGASCLVASCLGASCMQDGMPLQLVQRVASGIIVCSGWEKLSSLSLVQLL